VHCRPNVAAGAHSPDREQILSKVRGLVHLLQKVIAESTVEIFTVTVAPIISN
jgi:hypothetical protein